MWIIKIQSLLPITNPTLQSNQPNLQSAKWIFIMNVNTIVLYWIFHDHRYYDWISCLFKSGFGDVSSGLPLARFLQNIRPEGVRRSELYVLNDNSPHFPREVPPLRWLSGLSIGSGITAIQAAVIATRVQCYHNRYNRYKYRVPKITSNNLGSSYHV